MKISGCLIGFFILIQSIYGAVINSKDEESITLSNDAIVLSFQSAESGFGLTGIRDPEIGYDFLSNESETENLWRVTMKDAFNQFITIDNSVPSMRSYDYLKSSDGKVTGIQFTWNDINVGKEMDVLDVIASITLDESGMSYWVIEIDNKSESFGQENMGYGVWEVTYPIVREVRAAKQDSIYLAYPRYLGHLIKNPVERMPLEKMFYPAYRSKMQFSTLYKSDGSTGLYFGTFDPEANEKKFLYDLDEESKSIRYEVTHFPEGMGQSANGFNLEYKAAIGVYQGDWITASKMYRHWATRQFWCSKGKLSEREDIPKWYLNTVLWFSGMNTEKLIPLARYLDVPIAYQWYNWHEVAFDSYLPDYFPAKSDFKMGVKGIQEVGVKITPYINSRVWETNSKSWREESPYTAATKAPYKVLDGLSIHNWGPANKELTIHYDHWAGYNHAVMCPTTDIWQDKQIGIINRLVDEFDVNGVYMDQIASFYPVMCFDPGHGHTIGGGNYWVSGYREMIERAKDESRKIDAGSILTSEGHAETYLDLFDGNLACNSASIAPELIPMFHYVYSGYALTFGRATGRWHTEWYGDEYTTGIPLIMRNAQMFVWGEQLGWFNPNVLELPSSEAEYIKRLAKDLTRKEVKDYLFYGEMLRPLLLIGDNPILAAKWGSNQEDTEMPAVLHSLWKAEDGTLGLVFTNMDDTEHKISYEIDLKAYQISDSGTYTVSIVGGKQLKTYKKPIIKRTEKIPARGILILQIKSI